MSKLEPTARASLAAIIEHDLDAIARIERTLHELSPEAEYDQCAGVAYTIHNLYCALENSFEQISRSFENHIVDREQWHRELMLKMFLEIPGIRPSVFPAQVRPLFNELRSFRHVFRHSHDYQLFPERLNALMANWRSGGPSVRSALKEFTAWLRKGG